MIEEIILALKDRIAKRVREEVAPYAAEIAERITAEESAKVAVEISRWASFNMMGDTLRIEIKRPSPLEAKP